MFWFESARTHLIARNSRLPGTWARINWPQGDAHLRSSVAIRAWYAEQTRVVTAAGTEKRNGATVSIVGNMAGGLASRLGFIVVILERARHASLLRFVLACAGRKEWRERERERGAKRRGTRNHATMRVPNVAKPPVTAPALSYKKW